MRPGEARLAYVTDLEGMWDKLASFCDGNQLVRLDGERLEVAPGATFVFGGDAVDRGPGSRRLLRALVDVKRRQPGQVVLLAGNRDLNKLRLARELRGQPPARTPAEVRDAPRPALLRWIFEHTMGARGAFEHRAAELAAERGGAAAPEEDVVDSFLDDVSADGPLLAYLAGAQLAFRAGATLFVHGGLSRDRLGAVPGEPAPARPDGVDVDAWCARLNAWYASQVDAYRPHAADAGWPGWAPLIAYQAPLPGTKNNPASVVYGRLADEHNNLRLPDREVQAALARAGVRRVALGHTPAGDSPSILRDGAFELVCADNSHARHHVGSKVFLADDALIVDAATRLDGETEPRAVRFTLTAGDAGPVGRATRAPARLVKGPLGDGRLVLFRTLDGYQTEQIAVDATALGPLAAPY